MNPWAGLLLLAVGCVIGAVAGYRWCSLDERAIRDEMRDLHDRELSALRRREAETARVANEAIRALARVQAEVETGDGLAEAEDWRLWSEELREVAE